MYKDKGKQREAVRLATQRYRQRLKGITVIPSDVIPKPVIPVIPNDVIPVIPVIPDEPEPQSYNPMRVGYVPPNG